MYAMVNKPKAEQTANASKYPQGKFNPKPCRMCGSEFTPKAPSELYCCDSCKDRALTDKYLKRTYGISVEDYKRMHDEQGGLCKLCNGEGFVMKKSHKMKLVVDHCHATGNVRGLLCHNCNRALGLFKDSMTALREAISYLESAETIHKE